MKPSTKSLVGGLALVIIAAAVSAAGVIWQTNRAAQDQSLRRLQTASAVLSQLEASQLEQLQLRAEGLAHDTAFADYVAQSLIPNPQLGGAVDSASISDLLLERRKGYDIAVVLDPQGKPVASSGVLLRDPAGIPQDPLVTKAIRTHASVQGMWLYKGELLWVAVNPLMRGRILQGVLLAATHVDPQFVKAASSATDTGVVFVLHATSGSGPAPTSKVDSWIAEALAARLPVVLAVRKPQAMVLEDTDNSTTTWVHPLDVTGESAAVVLVDLQAAKGSVVSSAAAPLLLGVGVLFVFGLAVVLLQWQRTWAPLTHMLGFIDSAANGDRNITVRVSGSSIVSRLRDGINALLGNHPG